LDQFITKRVMHGGTYNGHPACMAAAVETLRILAKGEVYPAINRCGRRLMDGISEVLRRRGIEARIQGFPGIFHVAFGPDRPINSYRDTFALDRARYVRFTTALIERGVRALERGAWFLSSEHDEAIIDRTLQLVDDSAAAIA